MTITAKYPAKCATCGGAILPGQKIEWAKGSPTTHAACPSHPTPAAPRTACPKRPYSPTTCIVCGERAARDARGYATVKILRSGECVDCYEERRMGY